LKVGSAAGLPAITHQIYRSRNSRPLRDFSWQSRSVKHLHILREKYSFYLISDSVSRVR